MKKIVLAIILFISHSHINGMYPNVTLPMCNPTSTTLVHYNPHSNSNNLDFTLLKIIGIATFATVGWGIRVFFHQLRNYYKSDTNKQQTNSIESLWITTSDNKTLWLNIKKALPKSGLQTLLKTYSRYFGKLNNEHNPLRTNYSSRDYQLLSQACHALDYDMSQWDFTEEEQTTLFKMASASKILPLYLALINPFIQT